MGKCDNCRLRKESAKAFDIHWMGTDDCPYDKCPVPDFPKTNADRLRAMSDEELAEWLATVPMSYEDVCPNPIPKECNGGDRETCIQCWLDWLRQEAQDG